ncbi:MAG: PulJ/GspJ family protein, partial [Candidatus Anammoxibacter sp.]
MATMTDECRCEKSGFTMIEVMVALAIVSISLGVFISILGNSMQMRWKMEDHAKNVVTARVIAEKFSLGLLEDDLEGETEDGISWEI